MKDKHQNLPPRVRSAIDAYRSVGDNTDPMGSYTGLVKDEGITIDPPDPTGTVYRRLSKKERDVAMPVQDADDL